MKKFFNLPGVIALCCAVLFAALTVISCEVGLGESVDTYPPSLTVSYPAGDSLVIRDTFVMKGESSDETSLASVKISFEPTETSTVVVCCSLDVLADNRVKAVACHFFVEMGELNDNGCDITQV